MSLTLAAQSGQSSVAPANVEAVDLGLPSGTRWASCNVGATKPEEYGSYYAWGETDVKEEYNWGTYIHCDGIGNTCYDLGECISGTKYDVAHMKWGGNWKMPTHDQVKELIENCSYDVITINDVKGLAFYGKNGNSIFLPLAGCLFDKSFSYQGSSCYYWTGTQRFGYCAYYFSLYDYGLAYGDDYWNRCVGSPVRPVMNTLPSEPRTFIDLGLPSGTKWANMNVGASSPEEYGEYFAWGETVAKNSYSWDNYMCPEMTCGKSGDPVFDLVGDKADIAGTKFDAAAIHWGESWSMPTAKQVEELASNCYSSLVTINGVQCRKLKSRINGNEIIFPLAGVRWFEDFADEGSLGYYWASTLRQGGYVSPCRFIVRNDAHGWGWSMGGENDRFCGFPIRPVMSPANTPSEPLQLSTDHIELYVNMTATVSIKNGSGSYDVVNETPDVVDWDINKPHVAHAPKRVTETEDDIREDFWNITGKKVGSATLRIKDKISGEELTLQVDVVNAPALMLETSEVRMEVGKSQYVEIVSGSKWYEVESNRPDIVSATKTTIEGGSGGGRDGEVSPSSSGIYVVLKALAEGTADVMVRDFSSGQTAILRVVVGNSLSLTIDCDTLNFGKVDLGHDKSLSFTITNLCDSTVWIEDFSNTHLDFSLSWSAGAIPAHGSQKVKVTYTPTYVSRNVNAWLLIGSKEMQARNEGIKVIMNASSMDTNFKARTHLVILCNDSTKFAFSLNEMPLLAHKDGKLMVTSTTTSSEIELSKILKITYASENESMGIQEISSDTNAPFVREGASLIFYPNGKEQRVKIITIGGIVAREFAIPADQSVKFSLSTLMPDVYIISLNSTTYKMILR